jgi:hypothetical protein
VSAGFVTDVPGGHIRVARTRLILGLITPYCIYITIMKLVKESKARSRAAVPLKKKKKKKLHQRFHFTDTEA